MNRKNISEHVIAFLILAIPFIHLLTVWQNLPNKVPMHYNINMEVDRYGSKQELIAMIAIISVVGFVVYLLLKNLSYIDPKNQNLQSVTTMTKFSFIIVTFISILANYIIYSSYHVFEANFIFIMLGALLAAMGNLMHSIKQNYFLGIRTPWALSDEDNWRMTHQLASKVWFIGGLLLMILGFFKSSIVSQSLFFAIVVIMVILPIYYSYSIFRKTKIS